MTHSMTPAPNACLSYKQPPMPWQSVAATTHLLCLKGANPFSSASLSAKIYLSNPGDPKQQKFKEEVIATIQELIKADSAVREYFEVIFDYLPDFYFEIVNPEQAAVKGTIGSYTPIYRRLQIPMPATLDKSSLQEALRHESRHCFWHIIHLIYMKDNPFSTECFDSSNAANINRYNKALAADLAHIESLKTKLPSSSSKIRQQYETNPAVKAAYPLTREMHSSLNITVGTTTSHTPLKAPAKIISKESTEQKGLFIYKILYKDPLMAALHTTIDIEKFSLPNSYKPHERTYEREALLYGRLPYFMIAFLYPNLTKFLNQIIVNVQYSIANVAWPKPIGTTNDYNDARTFFEIQRFLSTHGAIKYFVETHSESSLYDVLKSIVDAHITDSSLEVAIYALNHITSKPHADNKYTLLLAQALNNKYKHAGFITSIGRSLTGQNNILIEATCKAYLTAFKENQLEPEDYADCLERLEESRNSAHKGKMKEIKRKGIAKCRAALSITDPRDQINSRMLRNTLYRIERVRIY